MSTTTTDAPEAANATAAAKKLIEEFCNIKLGSEDLEMLHIGGLPSYTQYGPVTDITITDISTDVALTEDTDYIWDENGRIIPLVWLPVSTYKIEYTAGYDDDYPASLEYLITSVASDIEEEVAAGPYQSETLGDYSYSLGQFFASANGPMTKYDALLNLYRRFIA